MSQNVPDNDVALAGFHPIMRKDRLTGLGGGVGLYVSQQLLASRRLDLECPDLDLLWAEIRIHNNKFYWELFIDPQIPQYLSGTIYKPISIKPKLSASNILS